MNPVNHQRWIVLFTIVLAITFAFTGQVLAGDKNEECAKAISSCEKMVLVSMEEGHSCEHAEMEDCEECEHAAMKEGESCDMKMAMKTISSEKSDAAFLGIYPTDLDEDKKEALDYKGDGVLVEGLVDDGPAVKSDLKAGDIIVKMGDKKVASSKDLRGVLEGYKAGDEMAIVVIRDGDEKKIDFKLGERPAREFLVQSQKMKHKMKKVAFLGVETEDIEGQLAEYFKVKYGVLIEEVVEGSAAEKAKLQAGDVIIRVGENDIESTKGLSKAIRSYEPGTKVEIQVVRKGKKKKFKAELGETSYPDFGGMGDIGGMYFDSDDFDMENIEMYVMKALKEANVHMDAGKDELKEQMKLLKEQMKELKEEMKKLKK